MSKLPVLTSKKIIKLLQKRGFILDHVTGSHHIYFHSEQRKRVTIPLHNKDLPRGTLISILKQAGLSKDDLL